MTSRAFKDGIKRLGIFGFFATFFFALLLSSAMADDLDSAQIDKLQIMYQQGSETAYQQLYNAAQKGNPKVQYALASSNQYKGLMSDAIYWFEQFINNPTVTKTERPGLKSFLMAQIGEIYVHGFQSRTQGQGVLQDYNKAIDWFRRSVDACSALGYYQKCAGVESLAAAYVDGRGVAQNNIVAYALYSIAMDKVATDFLEERISAQEVYAGNVLMVQMVDVGVNKALDQYLSHEHR